MVSCIRYKMYEKIVRNILSIKQQQIYAGISHNMYNEIIPVFDKNGLWMTKTFNTPWYDILANGPGAFIIKRLVSSDIIDKIEYPTNIVRSKQFIHYFDSSEINAIGKCWLGRDFTMNSEMIKKYHHDYCCHFTYMPYHYSPQHLKYINQFLTLDMYVFHHDVDTPNFDILLYSQKLKERYTVYKTDDFKNVFDEYATPIKLSKGDALIMNPSLVHKFLPNSKNIYNYVQFCSGILHDNHNPDNIMVC